LRRALAEIGEQVVATVPGGYRLKVEPAAVDASRFERLAADGRRELARGDDGKWPGIGTSVRAGMRQPADR
jgi:hypothetical protein